jgi:hypothetical protein
MAELLASRFSRMGARRSAALHHSAAGAPPPVLAPRTVDCEANPNLCEKPVNSDTLKVPITLGVVYVHGLFSLPSWPNV